MTYAMQQLGVGASPHSQSAVSAKQGLWVAYRPR